MSFASVRSFWIWLNLFLSGALFFATCLGICNTSAAAQQADAEPPKLIVFDIPAQPLRDALFAYTDVTGLSVLVDDGITSGRRSALVKGRFTAEDALKIVLTGTGLEFQYTAANAFTLVPSTASASTHYTPRDDSHDEKYFRAVQTAVKTVLCSRAQTLPGQYRVVVQLWIDRFGVVLRSALLDSTGSPDRDQTLSEMLNGLPVGAVPPTDLPQPVTLVILPRPPSATQDCGPVDDQARTRARD
jgi:hypothetical protein